VYGNSILNEFILALWQDFICSKIRSHLMGLFGLWELSLVNILLLSVDLRLHSLTDDILWMSSLSNHNHTAQSQFVFILLLCFSNTSAAVIWVLVLHRLFRFQLYRITADNSSTLECCCFVEDFNCLLEASHLLDCIVVLSFSICAEPSFRGS
jgi:hypothetical protein